MIDPNFTAFLRLLPSLLAEHAGEWALIREEKIDGFLPDYRTALEVGYSAYGLGGGWIVQEIKPDPIGERWLRNHDASEAEYRSWGLA